MTTAGGGVAVAVVASVDVNGAGAARGGGLAPAAPGSTACWQDRAAPGDGRGLGQSQDDGVQGQAHAGSHDGAVDADELQVAAQ